jgi:hypothetical protein
MPMDTPKNMKIEIAAITEYVISNDFSRLRFFKPHTVVNVQHKRVNTDTVTQFNG